MAQILALCVQILGYLVQLLPIVQQIREYVNHSAQETAPKMIEGLASDTLRQVNSATYGLSALHTDIGVLDPHLDTIQFNVAGVYAMTETIRDDIAALPAAPDYSATLQAILDAIAGLPTPPTPPTGGEIASDVWAFDDDSGYSAWWRLASAWSLAANLHTNVAFPIKESPMFTVEGYWAGDVPYPFVIHFPRPDWSDIGADESILAWLIRTDLFNAWELDANTGTAKAPTYVDGDPSWDFVIRPAFISFPARAQQPPPPVVIPPQLAAPVWPGESKVTLGATQALTSQLELAGPMHGCIVNVTTPPTKTGLRNIGNHPYDYNVGEVAFVSDRGDIEPWQYMGFRQALFTPKTMASASYALFRILAGAEGTARTFEITE